MIHLRHDSQKHQVMPLTVAHIMTKTSSAAIAPFFMFAAQMYMLLCFSQRS